jgi:hypothetical protein
MTALVPLIKGERFDDCLEKLTEVGVEAIWLYAAERAVVKLEPARLAERTRRWEAVLLAAARQAGRAAPPTLAAPGARSPRWWPRSRPPPGGWWLRSAPRTRRRGPAPTRTRRPR